jgi:hypothetical protein
MFNLPENTRRSAVVRWLGCSVARRRPVLGGDCLGYSTALWHPVLAVGYSLVAASLLAGRLHEHDWKPGTSSLQTWRLALARVKNLELETRESERKRKTSGTSREPERPQGRRPQAIHSGPGLLGRRPLGPWTWTTGHCLGPHVICPSGGGHG